MLPTDSVAVANLPCRHDWSATLSRGKWFDFLTDNPSSPRLFFSGLHDSCRLETTQACMEVAGLVAAKTTSLGNDGACMQCDPANKVS